MKNIDIEKIITERFPNLLNNKSKILRSLMVNLLKKILCVDIINEFIMEHNNKYGIEFIDELFEKLNFSYSIANKDVKKIPSEGRIICVANHPIGSLDGLALLKTISDIRADVKIVANNILAEIENINNLIIPLNIFEGGMNRESVLAIGNALEKEMAIILFPAGEVSRLKWLTIRDSRWSKGAVHFAKKYNSPILPFYIEARNSALFYSISTIYKKLSTLLLPYEVFNKKNKTITIKIGDPIPSKAFTSNVINDNVQSKLLKAHVYALSKDNKGIFITEKNIIHPIDRKIIKKELNNSLLLGVTPDNKKIILTTKLESPKTLMEIARLRELTFRKVGEGTGRKLDLDLFDDYYNHLVVWDENELEIVGSYRIGNSEQILKKYGKNGFYTNTLFNYSELFTKTIMPNSVELGRSFVQAKYWNTNALYYLWLGIGAYLANFPNVKYLFGGVSISNNYPEHVKQMMVYIYSKWFKDNNDYAKSFCRFIIPIDKINKFSLIFVGQSFKEDYKQLKQMLKPYGLTVPILYKHYSDLCEDDGLKFLDFCVDRDFENCIDGLILIDINKIKAGKKERYINCFYKDERNVLNMTS